MGFQPKYQSINKNASKVLIGAAISYGLLFILPAINLDFELGESTLSVFDILTGTGILILFASIALVSYGAKQTTTEISVKRFAWGSLIPMALIQAAIFSTMNDIDLATGFEATLPGGGTMFALLGMVLAFTGGAMSKTDQQMLMAKRGMPSGLQKTDYGTTQRPQYQQQRNQPQQPQYVPQQQAPQNPQSEQGNPPAQTSTTQTRFCSTCGTKTTSAKFCANCGSAIT